MADYTPARLRIGGEISPEQYQAIQEWTDPEAWVSFGRFYEIAHERARSGAFAALEQYLVEQGIAFDRYSAPALGADGCLAQYRPGMREAVVFPASGDNQERVVPVSAVQELLTACEWEGLTMEALLPRLRKLCGPVLRPLSKFRVRLE